MNNSPILHSDNHPEPNEDNTKITRDWDGTSDKDDFLHDIINTTPDIIYLIDLNSGNTIYMNKQAEELFGYDADYIYKSGVNFLQELAHPDDKQKRVFILEQTLDGAVIESNVKLKLKDGTYRLFKLRDRIIKKQFETLTWQTIGLGLGVTSKSDDYATSSLKVEDVLKEQSKLVQGIANAIPDLLFVLDLKTKSIIYANKQIASVLGYSDEQISNMGHPILDIIYEEDKPAMIKHLDDMQTAEDGEIREIEYRIKNVDGSLHWFIDRNTVFKRDSEGVPIEKIGIAQDITLRKTQENKINKSLKILQQTEELAQIGNWDFDIRTKKFTWSDGMYTLFGIKNDTSVTPSVYLNYVLEQDRPLAEKIVAAIQDTHEPFTEILRIQLANEVKTLKIKSGAYKDGDGLETSVVGVDMDITASILTEMQIKELNHNLQTKNRGLESANTDLKAFNTLAATNYRQTLQKLYTSMEYLITNDARNLSNEGRANIRRAQSSIQKMKLMTEDMINLSKLHTLDTQLAAVNLNDTITEALSNLNDKITEAKAKINFSKMPIIQGYSTLVSLLFYHLLDNAIKFRRQDTTLTININFKNDKLNDIDYHVIAVADNGIGFEEKDAQEVFTMFYRHSDTTYRGSGIGLAVCKKIMDIHDGFIIAKSTMGKETIFSCYFPVYKHEPKV